MHHHTRLSSGIRKNCVLLSRFITLALVLSLCGPFVIQTASAQLPLNGISPLPTPSPLPRPPVGALIPGPGPTPPSVPLTPPLVLPQHTLPPTVAGPRPPNGVPSARLPNIAAARNVNSAALGSNQQTADAWDHGMMRCLDECGGDEPPGEGPDPDFSTARIRPSNETGAPGVDLGSRNFNWSLPLVGLAGRSGLDLGLALYYNSLVWTKEAGAIRFNSDRAFPGPGPGFTLGFPKIQQRYVNQDYSGYSYMLVTPSGGHVELRQVGGTNIYQSADSSYTQLIDDGTSKLLRTTDGTQYSFASSPTDAEFNCIQITDRNGNYISATYNASGDIASVTDTLGRVISFDYDGANYLTSISQTWTENGQPQTHYWAQFSYSTTYVQTNFPGLWVQGPNNSAIPVLSAVTLADGSRYTFDYTSWGQVYQITVLAADSHQRAHVTYNLPLDASTAQSECPRFTEERQSAEYWGQPGQEFVTTFAADPNDAWTRQTQPDGTVYIEYFATAGWQNGLTVRTETYSPDDLNSPKDWKTLDWTQDDTSSYLQENPRVVEINSYDNQGHHKRIGIGYGPYAAYGLPYEVLEYAADAVTPARSVYTDYDLNPAYVDRRIIGLVSAVHVLDHTIGAFVSKSTYFYDWDNATNTYLIDQGEATNHDNTNYGGGFIGGRGNLCAVRRWNVNAINDDGQAMWVSFTGYNTNGSVIFNADGLGRELRIGYADAFSDGVNRSTFAYPSTTTDPGGFSLIAQFRYDFGGVTFTQDPKGARAQIQYDSVGRKTRLTNLENGAYSRWVYPLSQNYVDAFATIQENAGEAYSISVFDGAGRTLVTASALPGSVGGYGAQYVQYDSLGRTQYQSNPAETNSAWTPTGDDAVAGWQWTEQRYDYNDRPTLTVNPDGTTKESSYGGCGCAGGEVATIRDEHGRLRRMAKDVFGRLVQLQELNYDSSVYSTSDYAYNARDQIVSIVQQNDRARSFSYDGYGRLQTLTTPEQGTTSNTYYGDDRVQTVTDARGASRTLFYNSRGLVTNINYGAPGGVEPTPNVAFDYDAAGNRLWMTDGFGRVDYSYDTMSRLSSETRTFNGLGTYMFSYAYNLSGELTAMWNSWGYINSYSYDQVGRLATMNSTYGSASYITGAQYRAFGAPKQISYGNNRTLSMEYDNRLRPTRWDVSSVLGYAYNYDYFNNHTFRVSYAQNLYDSTLDRSYEYDQVGRLAISHSGAEARAAAYSGQWGTMDGPFSQGYSYDVWGNMTSRAGWGGWNASYNNATFNNKNQMVTNPGNGSAMQYDAVGNMTFDGAQSFTYDATGAQVQAPSYGKWQGHDGDGLRVKDVQGGNTTYYLRSTALGGKVVAEINQYGTWMRGYVYSGQQLIAIQSGGNYFVHQDPIAKSQRITNASGTVVEAIELDPFGGETNRSTNQYIQSHRYTSWERDWTGDESMFRRYHGWWSRFAHPDPHDGSYDVTDPQSFNRYSYVQNDPVNFEDPTGLYAACIHEAMTKFLGKLAGFSNRVANKLGRYAGDKPGGADSKQYSIDPRDNPGNYAQWALGKGPGAEIHFASEETLQRNIGAFRGDMRAGRYQHAAFTLHSIQDVHGAHVGFGWPLGHAGHDEVDWKIGADDKFLRAANETYQLLAGNKNVHLTDRQLNDLINAIIKGCRNNPKLNVLQPPGGGRISGGGPGGGDGGPIGFGGYPGWWYSMWAFVDWVNSITTDCMEWGTNEGPCTGRPKTPPILH
jgi:RHS repeat-associated protein